MQYELEGEGLILWFLGVVCQSWAPGRVPPVLFLSVHAAEVSTAPVAPQAAPVWEEWVMVILAKGEGGRSGSGARSLLTVFLGTAPISAFSVTTSSFYYPSPW